MCGSYNHDQLLQLPHCRFTFGLCDLKFSGVEIKLKGLKTQTNTQNSESNTHKHELSEALHAALVANFFSTETLPPGHFPT